MNTSSEVAGVYGAQLEMKTPVSLDRLADAAHQFEASMLQQLIAPLEHTSLESNGEESEGSTSALAGFANESLAKSISEAGGVGIARTIIEHLSKKS